MQYLQKMSQSEEDASAARATSLSPSISPDPSTPVNKKRKSQSENKITGPVKRKKTKKPKDINDDDLDVERGINRAIARMDNRLTADHVAQRTKRFESDMSLVELEDLYLPGIVRIYESRQLHC